MEYDVIQINLKLFGTDLQDFYAVLIYVIGSVLLFFSIFDIRAQKKKYWEDQEEMAQGKKVKIISRSRFMEFLHKARGMTDGISKFEIINVLMIIMAFINIALKYGYDSVVWEKVSKGVRLNAVKEADQDSRKDNFMEFSDNYLLYETLTILDSLLVFMIALSILKYTFFWIPSLNILAETFRTYFNTTIKRIFTFILAISMTFSLYCHIFYSYTSFGFFSLPYSILRTNLLFVQGALFNANKFYVVNESIEYVFEKVGWASALLNMGIIHLFGRYVVITIIVAFMKKDITAAIHKAR